MGSSGALGRLGQQPVTLHLYCQVLALRLLLKSPGGKHGFRRGVHERETGRQEGESSTYVTSLCWGLSVPLPLHMAWAGQAPGACVLATQEASEMQTLSLRGLPGEVLPQTLVSWLLRC